MPKETDIQALNEIIAQQKRLILAERAALVRSGAKKLSPLYERQVANLKHLETQLELVNADADHVDLMTLDVVAPEARAVSSDAQLPAFFKSLVSKEKRRSQSLDDAVDADTDISHEMEKK